MSVATRCFPISVVARRKKTRRWAGVRSGSASTGRGSCAPSFGRCLKAAGGRELRLMLPMVTEVAEIRQAREIIDREVKHLSRFAHTLPTALKLGAMVEVPSLLWQLDELMAAVDFVSVGSNDLFQFIMAADRGNGQVSGRFDPLSPAFLRVLHQIVETGEKNHTPVTLCGEMAGRPLTAMALIALGFRSISMAPASIGPVKAMLAALDVGTSA